MTFINSNIQVFFYLKTRVKKRVQIDIDFIHPISNRRKIREFIVFDSYTTKKNISFVQFQNSQKNLCQPPAAPLCFETNQKLPGLGL